MRFIIEDYHKLITKGTNPDDAQLTEETPKESYYEKYKREQEENEINDDESLAIFRCIGTERLIVWN